MERKRFYDFTNRKMTFIDWEYVHPGTARKGYRAEEEHTAGDMVPYGINLKLFPPKIPEDIDAKTGLTAAQMSVIVAKYNALSEFMAHMLGLPSDDLILPGVEAVQETEGERNARNARRLELREKLRKRKYSDWGGLIEDGSGMPLSGNQQQQREKEFKARFKEYLDAGVRLVLWQSGSFKKMRRRSSN